MNCSPTHRSSQGNTTSPANQVNRSPNKQRQSNPLSIQPCINTTMKLNIVNYYRRLFEALAGSGQSEVRRISLTRHKNLRQELKFLIEDYTTAIINFMRQNQRAILEGRMRLALESNEHQRIKDETKSMNQSADDMAVDYFPCKHRRFEVSESISVSVIDRPIIRIHVDVDDVIDDIDRLRVNKYDR